jgi:hypothetical protein
MSSKKKKTYTVHFMTAYETWENVEATSKKDAISQCQEPPEHDGNESCTFIAYETTKGE